MLNELRSLFRRSIDAFRDGLNTREPEDQVAELLSAMRRELVAARAAIPEHEAELARIRSDLENEAEALARCERQGAMAERIGDAETARIAADFGHRHRQKITVLSGKVAAAEAELELKRQEADEMRRSYQQADANRFALLAQLRRAGARDRMRATMEGAAADDWQRMEDRVTREASTLDAMLELDDASPRAGAADPSDAIAVEERLRELKRRLGRD
jgi:phage shock protein A